MTSTLVRLLTLLDMGIFCAKKFSFVLFFPELPLVGQLLFCLHPTPEQALWLSPLQWFTLALTPVWVLSKAGTASQLWSGTITPFPPAKDLAGHVAAFLTLKQSKMQRCKWDNVTTLLLWVFWSSMLPGLCATGQLRVHCLLLMWSFARVGEEVTPLRPFFSHQRHLGATSPFCPKLMLQVPDWFTTSDAQLKLSMQSQRRRLCLQPVRKSGLAPEAGAAFRGLFNLLA